MNNFDLRFAHAVRHKFGEVQILGLDPDVTATRLNLNTSYISLRVEATSRKRRIVPETEVSSEAILHHSKRALIRGQAGSGKTTLLQWIAVQCVDKALPPPAEIFNGHAPLMVRLRDYHGRPLPKGHEVLSTTSSALTELDPGDWFKDRLHRGRFIFLIDGLDEVSEDQRREVARWLEDLTLASPNSSYLVTTRPSAVDHDYLSNLDFDEYFLKPMTPAEVHSFVDYWHEATSEASTHDAERRAIIDQKRSQLTRLLEENRELIRLSATPLLCAVICTLNLDGRLQLISDRVDLYRTASQLLYHDRDKKNEIADPIYTTLSRKQKEKILSYIAYQFIKNGISSADIESIRQMVMRSRGLAPSEEGEQQAKALAEAIILRSGIVNEVAVNSVQFLHKTFQEYFAALEVVYQQDEIHVAKDFDLRSWGELYLIVLSIAPRGIAAEMVRIVFERAGSNEQDWAAYVLLAGAGCRKVPEVDFELEAQRVRTGAEAYTSTGLECRLPISGDG